MTFGALISDVYEDWTKYENTESNAIHRPKTFKSKSSRKHKIVEGFENNVTNGAIFESSFTPTQAKKKNTSIHYGSPQEYLYNMNNKVVDNKTEEQEPKVSQVSESPKEIEEMRLMIKDLMKQVQELTSLKEEKEINDKEKLNSYDLLLFIIFGLFFIFVLEGFAKIVSQVALKRGGF